VATIKELQKIKTTQIAQRARLKKQLAQWDTRYKQAQSNLGAAQQEAKSLRMQKAALQEQASKR